MNSEQPTRAGWRPWLEALAVLAVVALGGTLRHSVAVETFPVQMMGDEHYYTKVANTISNGKGHFYQGLGGPAHAWRPPAHAWVLSNFVNKDLPLSEYLWPMVRLQVLLGTALILATWLLGRGLFGSGTGLLAALATALSPPLIAFSHYLWSETLFALLITLGLALIAFQCRRMSWLLALVAGALLGAAALTRELAIGVAVIGAFWWLVAAAPGQRLRAALLGATMLLAVAAVVLPWSLRNQAVLGRFVLVGNVGWFAAAEGNTLDADDWLYGTSPDLIEFREEYFRIPLEMRRARFARKHLQARVAAEQPTWILKKFVRNTSMLLDPDSFVFEKIRRGSYPNADPERLKWITWGSLSFYFLALVLGAAGLAVAGPWRPRLLAWLVLGAVLGVHVLANASTRFRVPWWPLVFVFASHLLLHPGVLREGRRWRWILAVLLVLLFAGLRAPQLFAGLGEMLGEAAPPE